MIFENKANFLVFSIVLLWLRENFCIGILNLKAKKSKTFFLITKLIS